MSKTIRGNRKRCKTCRGTGRTVRASAGSVREQKCPACNGRGVAR